MGWFSFLQPTKPTKYNLKAEKEPRLLVVPVDNSEHSLQALEWAVTNIYRSDRADQLHLLSVVATEPGPYPAEVCSGACGCNHSEQMMQACSVNSSSSMSAVEQQMTAVNCYMFEAVR